MTTWSLEINKRTTFGHLTGKTFFLCTLHFLRPIFEKTIRRSETRRRFFRTFDAELELPGGPPGRCPARFDWIGAPILLLRRLRDVVVGFAPSHSQSAGVVRGSAVSHAPRPTPLTFRLSDSQNARPRLLSTFQSFACRLEFPEAVFPPQVLQKLS